MPRTAATVLFALMVFTTLCGTFAWAQGAELLMGGGLRRYTHPAYYLALYLVCCGLIIKQHRSGWIVLLALSALQCISTSIYVFHREQVPPSIQFFFMDGEAATALFCLGFRTHFD